MTGRISRRGSASGLCRGCCLVVACVFAVRAGAGLLLPDVFAGADSVCESELESPTEELEFEDHQLVIGAAPVVVVDRWALVPFARPVALTSRAPSARLCLRPPLLRGPPA